MVSSLQVLISIAKGVILGVGSQPFWSGCSPERRRRRGGMCRLQFWRAATVDLAAHHRKGAGEKQARVSLILSTKKKSSSPYASLLLKCEGHLASSFVSQYRSAKDPLLHHLQENHSWIWLPQILSAGPCVAIGGDKLQAGAPRLATCRIARWDTNIWNDSP